MIELLVGPSTLKATGRTSSRLPNPSLCGRKIGKAFGDEAAQLLELIRESSILRLPDAAQKSDAMPKATDVGYRCTERAVASVMIDMPRNLAKGFGKGSP
jgi:hypothetical protein